jgi:excinuclease ABC subunit C
MTKEDFPRIFWTHQIKLKPKLYKEKPIFVGPFVDGKALKQTLKILRKIFPFRSCRKIPNRPCLWYHLNRCPAPCLLKSKIIKEIPKDSLKVKKIAQRNAKNLIKVLERGKRPVLINLKREMGFHSKRQEFEEAAKIRDKIRALEKVFLHSKIFEIEKPEEWKKIEKELKKILNTKKRISRIEAYDVSNIRGKLAAGSMVTFIDGKEDKNLYRRFKIKFAKRPNDLIMIKECLIRRFEHPEWQFPDLILIDGGKAQLNAALEALKNQTLKEKPKFLSLAKKERKLFIENKEKPIFLKDLGKEISNFLLRMTKEAHRFAVAYHKKLRKKFLLGK